MHMNEQPDGTPNEEQQPRRRRRRPQELWERETEPYPGALALWDLEDACDEDAATILARVAVARCLVAAARGRRGQFRRERAAARAYVLALPAEVQRPLRRVLHEGMRAPRPLYRALRAAGMQAADAGHAGAAYTFLRMAFELATMCAQRRAAARLAAHLARLAAADDAPYSAHCWTARMRALLDVAPESGPERDTALRPVTTPAALPAGRPVPSLPLAPYLQPMNDEGATASSGGGYDAEARRTIQAALAAGAPLTCPACGAPLAVSDVPQPAAVSYVRRRVWVLCTGCRRTASLDAPRS